MADLDVLLAEPHEVDELPAASDDGARWQREHFIPLRRSDLVELLSRDESLDEESRVQFLKLCDLLAATFHHDYRERLDKLKDLYAAFNPDAVTLDMQDGARSRDLQAGELFEELVSLLERANYHRLSRDEIEQAVGAASEWGVRLNVDFDVFERLEVFARGDVVAKKTRQHWTKLYKPEEVDVPIYQRLIVVFQLREHKKLEKDASTEAIYLKLFKNIPKQDVDMLLPGASFKMSLFDHGKVMLPTLSGLILALVKGLKIAFLSLFTGFWGVLVFLGFVGGTAGYGVKSFLGYLRTKDKYQLSLTRSLYYQNLDNNAGVLFRLLDEAEEQDLREAILAYALLRRRADHDGWTAGRLDEAAESFLREVLGFEVDFEIHDALDKLQRLGCLSTTESGCWKAVALDEALATVTANWNRSG